MHLLSLDHGVIDLQQETLLHRLTPHQALRQVLEAVGITITEHPLHFVISSERIWFRVADSKQCERLAWIADRKAKLAEHGLNLRRAREKFLQAHTTRR